MARFVPLSQIRGAGVKSARFRPISPGSFGGGQTVGQQLAPFRIATGLGGLGLQLGGNTQPGTLGGTLAGGLGLLGAGLGALNVATGRGPNAGKALGSASALAGGISGLSRLAPNVVPPSVGNFAGGVGLPLSIGQGALNLAQGNIGAGVGQLGGLGLGAAIGSVIPGVGTLLGAGIGGFGGGLFGSLFGGGGSFFKFPKKFAETQSNQAITLNTLSDELQRAQSREDVLNALANFRTDIEFGIRGAGGVGGFGTNALSEAAFLADPSQIQAFIPNLPGGLPHKPGGPSSFGLDQLTALRQTAVQLLQRLPSGPVTITRRLSQQEAGRIAQEQAAASGHDIFGNLLPVQRDEGGN